MPIPPPKLETATIEEIWWDDQGKVKDGTPSGNPPKKFKVQFNPQTLKVTFSNQKAGGDQPKGSSTQFVGKGVTKLALELWFDISLALAQGKISGDPDVRRLTGEVAYFMAPQEVKAKGKKGLAPPGLRFHWGSFLFEGVLDSLDETLDLFDDKGNPLRASLALNVSKQEIQYDASKAAALGEATVPGSQPLTAAPAGKSVQQMAAQSGNNNWRDVALANGIENPRMLGAGALVNLSAGVSVSGAAQLGVDVSAGAQVSASAGLSASAGFSAGAGVSAGSQATIGFSSSTQVSSAGGGIQLGFTSGASVTGGAAVSGGSVNASFSAGGGFGGGV